MRMTRRDEKLDSMLGKKVIVIFKDDSVQEGILEFVKVNDFDATYLRGKYKIGSCYFRKTFVKKVRLAE